MTLSLNRVAFSENRFDKHIFLRKLLIYFFFILMMLSMIINHSEAARI